MILDCAGVSTHLSYCTNIHAGDAWCDVLPELQRQLPRVRKALDHDSAMGIGLRLSRNSLESLRKPETLAEFRQWLDEQNHYVFTINGFPYGAFHGERVKEEVYKPDWTEVARLDYTCHLATLLCELDPPDNYGSISTLPGTYKDWMMPGTEALISQNLIRAVAHCVSLEQRTGVTIALALEPEPCCMLETVAETVTFFRNHLFDDKAIDSLVALTGLSRKAADEAMHRHIGVCYDVCHSAVEFENPAHAIARLQSAGIDIIKLQLSSALEIPLVNEASLRHLTRFDEPVYLHQVVEMRGKTITRYNDIRSAVAATRYRFEARSTLDPALRMAINAERAPESMTRFSPVSEPDAQWRVHFHVPVFIEHLEHFSTTQSTLSQVLQLQKLSGFCRHLEVETYTWDVLPERYRQQSVSRAIACELNWIRERLHSR
ncbi:MAG: metabolite traffic protein EboE [Granulosicoccus sp.]|nr:metabolite traffic protein EboE [Granulosicoccus sp.]